MAIQRMDLGVTADDIAQFTTAISDSIAMNQDAEEQALRAWMSSLRKQQQEEIDLRAKKYEKIREFNLISTREEIEAEKEKLKKRQELLDKSVEKSQETVDKLNEQYKKAYDELAQAMQDGTASSDEILKQQEELLKLEKQIAREKEKQAAAEEKSAELKAEENKLDQTSEKQLKKNAKRKANLEKAINKQTEAKKKADAAKEKKANLKAAQDQAANAVFGKGVDVRERVKNLKASYNAALVETGGSKAAAMGAVADALTKGLSTLAQQLDNQIESIASMKTVIDTRLQGSDNARYGSSYWEQMSKDIVGIAGVSPLVSQASIAENVKTMVSQGIAFNVEQRALIATIKDKIADTFDATDSTLKRLIRIQQEDSTANRLGMESALNTFMNQMYENSEYLGQIAAGVRSSLEEAQSLMEASAAAELEYEVEKWLGSLYSVGASQNAVNTISGALGKVAAGDISGLTGGGGNLVIMAAGQAGLSITDILEQGLYGDNANKLLSAMVEYLAGIYDSSKDSKVIQQQIANVYGLQASDLKAITNLLKTTDDQQDLLGIIKNTSLNYNDMLSQLASMTNSMSERVSLGERLKTMWENVKYSTAAGIANNPVLYGIYKIAGLLDTTVGGIAIPAVYAMGTGVDLQTTVADLMRVGAMGGGILDSLAQIVGGGGNGGLTASSLLSSMGVGKDRVKMKTKGRKTGSRSRTTSESGYTTYTANAESGIVQSKTMAEAADTKVQAQESAGSTEITLSDFYEKITNNYLSKIVDSVNSISMRMTGFAPNTVIASEPDRVVKANAVVTRINRDVFSEFNTSVETERDTLKSMLNTILTTLQSISGNTNDIKTNTATTGSWGLGG